MARDTTIAALCVLAYAAACLVHGWAVDHYVVLNDFWGNAFAASRWAWTPDSQWNGFYPPGYPTLLAVLPGARLVESAYVVNVLAGSALLMAVWIFTRRLAGPGAGLAALLVVAAHPLVVTQVLTTGADILFVLTALAGTFVLFDAVAANPASLRRALVAGALLGLAGWVRYHAFAWSAAVLAAALLIGGRKARPAVVAAWTVVGAAGAGLVWLGLAAGDLGALQRDQAFNVYSHLVSGVNWFHVQDERLPATVLEAIDRDRAAFVRNYLAFSAPHLWLAVPLVAAVVLASDRVRRFAWFTLATGVIFVPWVNLGGSPRGLASYVPLVIVAVVAAVASRLATMTSRPLRIVAALAIAIATGLSAAPVWYRDLSQFLQGVHARAAVSREIERVLRADRVRLAAQVFSVADFYFVGATGWNPRSYHPHVIGGWPTVDLPGFLETYPPPSTRTLDAFLDDCLRFGITHVVLSSAAGQAQRELGQLFDGRLTSLRVVDLGGVPGVRVFRIQS